MGVDDITPVDLEKTVTSVEDAQLLAMGKKPELQRVYNTWTCQTLLMTSLAEYCGIWPTAGGQQYYIQALSTRSTRPFLSYVVGWAIMVGEISTGSSCALNSAQIIAAFVQIAHPATEWKVSSI
ncbi:hypothetical protein PHISCL_03786 [Aspergillus sclerotialis]|uniref:Amino acid permease n=1 Tax=Aspergillus sclerotialis TaxID=2070753 RepID=A0A3A2ZX42_9EURO|nr:hypothetical protein PHISCL_03786 [Aspergillus sclerotialis]